MSLRLNATGHATGVLPPRCSACMQCWSLGLKVLYWSPFREERTREVCVCVCWCVCEIVCVCACVCVRVCVCDALTERETLPFIKVAYYIINWKLQLATL